nr:TIGR02679 family protein [Glycomyces amatae]
MAALWKEAHRRLSTGAAVTAIRLRGLHDDERHALAELLATDRLPDADPRITIAALRESLDPIPLETVLTELVGPVDDQTARRREAAAEREGLWTWLASHPLLSARPALQAWAARLRAEPLITTVTETRDLIGRALAVIEALPAELLPLPVLAQRTLGGPHALDTGRLPALVLRAIAVETGRPDPLDAEQRREVWEAAGVVCDELSSTVLVAGLAPEGDSFLASTLRAAKAEGEAVAVTLGQLRRSPITFAPSTTVVSVVENPSVVQAALDRFGAAVPPLICVSGRLHVAARRLLRALTTAGLDVRYHGDFDPAGISIATDVITNLGARPWRMGAADYLDALAPGPGFDPDMVPATPWDATLREAMRREATTVYEEAVVDGLLDDLAIENRAN